MYVFVRITGSRDGVWVSLHFVIERGCFYSLPALMRSNSCFHDSNSSILQGVTV